MPIDLTSDRSSTSTTFPLLRTIIWGSQEEAKTPTLESFRYFGDGDDAVSLSRVYYEHGEYHNYTTTVTNNYDNSSNGSIYPSFPPRPPPKPSLPNRLLTHRTRILTTHYLTIPATTSLLFFVGFTFLLIRETHRAISLSPPSLTLTPTAKKKNMNMLTCSWNPPTKVVGLMTLYFVAAGMMVCLLWATGRKVLRNGGKGVGQVGRRREKLMRRDGNGERLKEVGVGSLRLTSGDGGGDGGWVPQDLGVPLGRRERVRVVGRGGGGSGVGRETFTGWVPQDLAKPRARNGYDSPYWQQEEEYGESGLVGRSARIRCLIPPGGRFTYTSMTGNPYSSPSTKSRPQFREASSSRSIPVSDGTRPVPNVGIQQITSWTGLGGGQMSEASRAMARRDTDEISRW